MRAICKISVGQTFSINRLKLNSGHHTICTLVQLKIYSFKDFPNSYYHYYFCFNFWFFVVQRLPKPLATFVIFTCQNNDKGFVAQINSLKLLLLCDIFGKMVCTTWIFQKSLCMTYLSSVVCRPKFSLFHLHNCQLQRQCQLFQLNLHNYW